MKEIIDHIKQEWFKYVMEILVLIIGIYGAFALDNWNNNNAKRKEELEILRGCKSELTEDLKEIKFNMGELNESLRSLNILLEVFDQDLPYHDSLAYHFNYTLLPMHFVHSTSTFETLRSNGLDIVSNDEIRAQLITLYDSQYEFFLQGESEELTEVQYNMRNLIPDRFESSWNYQGDSFEGMMIPLDFEELKTDSKYQYFLKTQRNRTKSYLGYFYTNLKNSVESMIYELDLELSKIEK